MSEYVPLYKELYLPIPRPDLVEKTEKPSEKMWSRIVIDLGGDAPDEKTPYDQD